MVRRKEDRIGGQPVNDVEVDENLVGGKRRGAGRGENHEKMVNGDVEV